eukprot:6813760-Lingulodinium_polyedra.AAC.1
MALALTGQYGTAIPRAQTRGMSKTMPSTARALRRPRLAKRGCERLRGREAARGDCNGCRRT